MEKEARNRSLGPAAMRLLKSLAEEAPEMLSRDELLKSDSLKKSHGKSEVKSLDENEVMAAAKTLGRLIAKGDDAPLREVLTINRRHADIPAKEVGLVGVSTNLSELRNRKMTGKAPGTQEDIIDLMIINSRKWCQNENNSIDGFPLVFVTGAYIVHGSTEYDITIFVNYSDMETYTRYIREVVQQIDGVQNTHTMQVSYGNTNSPFF